MEIRIDKDMETADVVMKTGVNVASEACVFFGEGYFCKTEAEALEAAELLKAFFEAKAAGKKTVLIEPDSNYKADLEKASAEWYEKGVNDALTKVSIMERMADGYSALEKKYNELLAAYNEAAQVANKRNTQCLKCNPFILTDNGREFLLGKTASDRQRRKNNATDAMNAAQRDKPEGPTVTKMDTQEARELLERLPDLIWNRATDRAADTTKLEYARILIGQWAATIQAQNIALAPDDCFERAFEIWTSSQLVDAKRLLP